MDDFHPPPSGSTGGEAEIFVNQVGGEFLLFDSNSVDLLLNRYRIVADSIEPTANEYGAKQLPTVLLPEQVQVLLECGFIRVRRVVDFSPRRNCGRSLVKPPEAALLKERKRKAAADSEVSSKKRKIRRTELREAADEVVVDEAAVERMFEEIREKKLKKSTEECLQLNYDAPSEFYEVLEDSQVVFPSTADYRLRLVVFRDLWRKGFFLTAGHNFGCHFLAYEGSPAELHAKYMVFCQHTTVQTAPLDMMSLSRVATQVRKEVLWACVSDDTLAPYYTKLFFSFFKSLVGREVVVELKNDLSISGTLHSVDQYLNVKLVDISVHDTDRHPHMLSVKNCFIRGSVVRYIQLPTEGVDTQLLQEATRKEILQSRQQQAKQQAA
ncbi:TRNA-intron lyase [Aphelenchoides fujianensis]|nr:TRNA-intron lyase [Aphelenchoides fujianensis]